MNFAFGAKSADTVTVSMAAALLAFDSMCWKLNVVHSRCQRRADRSI